MSENALVVVFPSIFAKNKQNLLVSSIKKILKNQGQEFGRITRDEDLVIIDANDPVFASSSVNQLFGISRVCIARQVDGRYDTAVSSIAKIGANLLLKGEKFHVKVEGRPSGYIPKDVEVAATSALIEQVSQMGCVPGTEEKHDKQIYCYLTRKNAYVSIFSDEGHGGVPHGWQGRMVCCMYDELSAVSCIEALKQGFDVTVIVCYNDSNLMELVKILNRIIPRMLSGKVTLEFFRTHLKQEGAKAAMQRAKLATHLLCHVAKQQGIPRVGLGLSPLAYPAPFIDENSEIILRSKLVPWVLLAGIDEQIVRTAKEIGLGKYLHKIERFGTYRFPKDTPDVSDLAKEALRTGQKVTVTVGPNNMHDILDSLKH